MLRMSLHSGLQESVRDLYYLNDEEIRRSYYVEYMIGNFQLFYQFSKRISHINSFRRS